MVNFRAHRQSYKSKKKIENPQSEWKISRIPMMQSWMKKPSTWYKNFEARFQMLADYYEQEQSERREKIEMLKQAKKYLHLKRLTPAVLNDLVKAFYVHAPDNSSGHRVQDAEIRYNYIGILPATLLYDLLNEKTA